MGSIIINRPHNECGKIATMDITINGKNQQFKDSIEDDETKTIDVPDGDYKVFVEQQKKSNKLEFPISGNSVNLTATIFPKEGKIEIEKVVLSLNP